jgi:antirestriction protein
VTTIVLILGANQFLKIMNNAPRIYVACLAAYSNGKLHGDWIDCDKDADKILSEIKLILAKSPEPNAEDWAIHDYENWHSITIREHESIERIAELATLIQTHGSAFAYYYEYFDLVEGFEDSYRGCYESEEDFVRESLTEQGIIEKCERAGLSECYIDWERIARDWFICDYVSFSESYDQVHIFSRG